MGAIFLLFTQLHDILQHAGYLTQNPWRKVELSDFFCALDCYFGACKKKVTD